MEALTEHVKFFCIYDVVHCKIVAYAHQTRYIISQSIRDLGINI